MKLKHVRVRDFQSIRDSNQFDIGNITCLVGKNEAGKTALLQAIYRLNPVIESDNKYDVTDDYPRSDVEDYLQSLEQSSNGHAIVAEAIFDLEDNELNQILNDLGSDVLNSTELVLEKGYSNQLLFSLATNPEAAIKFILANSQLPPDTSAQLEKCQTPEAALEVLQAQEKTEEITRLIRLLTRIAEKGLCEYIYETYISAHLPKFLYFDEYYQMRGHENVETLKQRVANKQLHPSDHPMLGLLELARIKLEDLTSHKRTQSFVNKLEGAGNHLGKQVLKYWSQNKHLQTRFDVRPGLPGDPEDMRSGNNIWASVYDARHMVTTNLGTRSRGFVWFFSFLAWYSQIKKRQENVILLLDEPGLSLHAKAQKDLLDYFEKELMPNHQVIYTTHSPFMVDPQHFERVRIVQDNGLDADDEVPAEDDGTKVFSDVLEASSDSLFPLQGALGYEIYQTLFIGPNSLVVEGISDLLYIQTLSRLLEKQGKIHLDARWVITPVGGSDKVSTFVALIGAQTKLKVATLIDFQKKDQQMTENLYRKKLLKKKNVLTFADFVSADEADIEDMFESDFYLSVLNDEYKNDLVAPVKINDLNANIPRMVVRLEKYFEDNPLKNGVTFNHYRPARYLAENISELSSKISEQTFERFEEAFRRLNLLL